MSMKVRCSPVCSAGESIPDHPAYPSRRRIMCDGYRSDRFSLLQGSSGLRTRDECVSYLARTI
jgi:hypothetical protein